MQRRGSCFVERELVRATRCRGGKVWARMPTLPAVTTACFVCAVQMGESGADEVRACEGLAAAAAAAAAAAGR
jgi:hypothetical protein